MVILLLFFKGAPPSPTGLRADPQPAADGCSWLVTLSWRLADECTYPTDLYSQCIQVDCDTTSYHDERQVCIVNEHMHSKMLVHRLLCINFTF